MFNPFEIVVTLAARLGLSEGQTAVGIGIMAVVIGLSVISLVKGNIMAAVRLVAIGMALFAFALLSNVASIISNS